MGQSSSAASQRSRINLRRRIAAAEGGAATSAPKLSSATFVESDGLAHNVPGGFGVARFSSGGTHQSTARDENAVAPENLMAIGGGTL
jgi:hypothetical protein